MSECTHDCSSCSQECSERSKESLLEKPHDQSNIKKVIGVVSGKGGVGKSIVSSMLAVNMKRLGYKTAVLDADITGPSIPKAFGIKEKASGNENGIDVYKRQALFGKNSLNSEQSCAASILLCANTRVGLLTFAITLAIVKVLPEPVTPRRVCSLIPLLIPSVNFDMASG